MKLDLSKIEGFEWDRGNLEHIKKHKVKHGEYEEVFNNMPFLSKDELHSKIEERFHALGITNNRKLLFIAFTIRDNKIRVISARDQDKKEKSRMKRFGGEN